MIVLTRMNRPQAKDGKTSQSEGGHAQTWVGFGVPWLSLARSFSPSLRSLPNRKEGEVEATTDLELVLSLLIFRDRYGESVGDDDKALVFWFGGHKGDGGNTVEGETGWRG